MSYIYCYAFLRSWRFYRLAIGTRRSDFGTFAQIRFAHSCRAVFLIARRHFAENKFLHRGFLSGVDNQDHGLIESRYG